jgi:hypothetical protein
MDVSFLYAAFSGAWIMLVDVLLEVSMLSYVVRPA